MSLQWGPHHEIRPRHDWLEIPSVLIIIGSVQEPALYKSDITDAFDAETASPSVEMSSLLSASQSRTEQLVVSGPALDFNDNIVRPSEL
jgi:hypothetical protein